MQLALFEAGRRQSGNFFELKGKMRHTYRICAETFVRKKTALSVHPNRFLKTERLFCAAVQKRLQLVIEFGGMLQVG